MIIEKNTFESCCIVCAAHFTILNYTGLLPSQDDNSYDRLRENVLRWMSAKNLSKVTCQDDVVLIFGGPYCIAAICHCRNPR